ncbi:MAG TPA: antibiotic biosynthesis monooxygenase [Hellea balneolensis]|uniref:Antibiotic biosynthesis monooxygenase n=1 Tax=Hellea balneolensis TaxID=287478 RepID=A0A7C5M2X7_9PROT|nr:antibiotic biosynthesis monooxygenase [Hellea balneolensis]
MAEIVLTGYVTIPENELSAISEAIPQHVRLTRAEPGCLEFKIAPHENDPCRFSVYERFVDQAAFDFHQDRTRNSEWAKLTKNMKRYYNIV